MKKEYNYVCETKNGITKGGALQRVAWIVRLYRWIERYPRLVFSLYYLRAVLFFFKKSSYLIERKIWFDADKSCCRVPKLICELKIAAILDEFSYRSFKDEAIFLAINPSNWLDVFEQEKPDLFFCESAWKGTNCSGGSWCGKIYKNGRSPEENRVVLLSILRYCMEHDIPTIFWNKEDPIHYADAAHDFADTASKFDHIFTTARECEARYRNDFGHCSVHTLMFGVQPRLFNPIEDYNRTDEVTFAGSWYAYLQERCRDMEAAFHEVILTGKNLVIYDRYFGDGDPHHAFPKLFASYIKSALPYEKMDLAYKGSRYALSITTVTDSETMFARRIFELAASNTVIISNYAKGIFSIFKEDILYLGRSLRFEDLELKKLRNLRRVLRSHTCKQRLEQLLCDIGFAYQKEQEIVTVFYCVTCLEDARKAEENFRCIKFENKVMKTLWMGRNPEQKEQDALMAEMRILYKNSHYYILADFNLSPEFIGDAILHFSYLDETIFVGQSLGETRYKFCSDTRIINSMFKHANLHIVKSYLENKNIMVTKYRI